ncbi:hypothetical protein HA49_08375 [Tatumella morbirosei]|uniref:DUF669 domain-containing protein n=1 Tax=Tatumella morbirosei TaxID=642227 RepID=A0A095TEA9_9GAMM|nr:hypothetical protein [Tatumella morbirosei]KGD75246.1 hypothetical protein HA49_08375 [Tatumella morbirosei]
MTNVIFTYNQEAALTAGQGGFINESGAYVITITEAALKSSSDASSQARSIEFSGETDDGRKVQYLSVWVTKKDGTDNTFGVNMIHAIMGCAGVKQLTNQMKAAGQFVAPEFAGKRVGLVLQKLLRSKNDGSDTYGLEIRMPFIAQTHQTLLEKSEGKTAEAVEKMAAGLKDKDERKKPSGNNNQSSYSNSGFDDNFDPFA